MRGKREILCTIMAVFLMTGLLSIGMAANADIVAVTQDNATKINESALSSAIGQMPLSNLTNVEKEGLLYMVEEEKLAGDVYITLNQKWNLRVFTNIENAEQTHEAAVKTLISRYGLNDPTSNQVGKFSNIGLQKTYDEMVSIGNTSLKDALEVGAAIEEIDLLDLEKRISQTDKADIKLVYENLMRGSRNHLKAFVLNLNRQGYEYAPKYLDQKEYDSIIGSQD